jgi:hypothetical protein
MNLSSVNEGTYPAKPYFSSTRERLTFTFMIASNIAVVGYWLVYLTWGGA